VVCSYSVLVIVFDHIKVGYVSPDGDLSSFQARYFFCLGRVADGFGLCSILLFILESKFFVLTIRRGLTHSLSPFSQQRYCYWSLHREHIYIVTYIVNCFFYIHF